MVIEKINLLLKKLALFPQIKLMGFIFILALLVRLGAMFVLQEGCYATTSICMVTGDQLEFLGLADNLLKGKGFTYDYGFSQPAKPYVYRPPGYPLFAAFFLFLFHDNLFLLRLTQILLSSISVVFIFILASYFMPKTWAFFTGIISCFVPYFFYHSFYFISDALYHNFFLIGLALLFYFLKAKNRDKNSYYFALPALFISMAALTRSEAYYLNFLIMIFLGVLVIRKNLPLKKMVVYCLIFSIPIMVWMGRNWVHSGRYIGLQAKTAGLSLMFSYQSVYSGVNWPEYDQWSETIQKRVEEIEKNKNSLDFLTKEVTRFLFSHPRMFLYVTAAKAVKLWKIFPEKEHSMGKVPYRSFLHDLYGLLCYGIFIPFAIGGFFLMHRKFPLETLFLFVLFLGVTTIGALSTAAIRHRVVIMPVFYLLTTYSFMQIFEWCKDKRESIPTT